MLATATDVTVSVTGGSSGGQATSGTDFNAVADFTINLAAGATSATATFNLVVSDDTTSEGPETITVSGTTTASLTVTPGALTINDDDKLPAMNASGCTDGTHVTDPSTNTGLVADCQNLVAARNHWTNHPANVNLAHNHNLRTWTGDITTWSRVTITANRVTQLRLFNSAAADASQRIGGTIPAQLGNLANLTGLYLNSNRLTGAIPAQLGNLANLVNLWLTGNGLSGAIPAQLGNLANLQHLLLNSNQLSGAIPTELGNLANLTLLYLNNNGLSEAIPTELGSLASLQRLLLSNNQLSGAIPAQLGSLANLTLLWLSNNRLTGGIPAQLGSLANLTQLLLNDNHLTGAIPAQLGSLTAINIFRFCQNYLTGALPTQLRTGVTLDFTPGDYTMIQTCVRTDKPATGIELRVNPAEVLEGSGSGTTKITVTAVVGITEMLTGSATVTVSVAGGTSSGQATAGVDFTAVGDFTITIANGAASGTGAFDLAVTDDNASEGPETITVSGTTTASLTGSITSATLTVNDDDDPAPAMAPAMDPAGCTNGTYVANPTVNTGLAADCRNLVAARNHWTNLADNHNLAAGHNLRNWTGDIITWPGVRTAASRVTVLDLRRDTIREAASGESYSITGEIPTELGNLTNLTHLYLNDNRLTGEIPTELGNLSALSVFWFCQNYLTGALPAALRTGVTLDFTGSHTNIRTCRRGGGRVGGGGGGGGAYSPPPAPPSGPDFFDDDDGSGHEAAINALAQAGITRGCAPKRFCPDQPTTRAQLAVLLYRSAARHTGINAPYAGRVALTDVPPGAAWWNAAQWAASTGVIPATPDGEFDPAGAVTRAGAAIALAAAFEHLGLAGVDLSAEPQNLFTDAQGLPDTTVNAMEALHRRGITLGCSADPLRFCPDQPTTRAQIATLLARTIRLIPTA